MKITQTTDERGVQILRATKRGATNVFGWTDTEGRTCSEIDKTVYSFQRLNIPVTAQDLKGMQEALDSLGAS